VKGHEVTFRVLPSTEAAYAWADGAKKDTDQAQGYMAVGEGWVASSLDLEAFSSVASALTTA
jgi:hypothetical protein